MKFINEILNDMATRINKGSIKLLLYELVLVLLCLNKKKHEIFQADRNDYMVNRLPCKNFCMLVLVFHVRVFHVQVFHVRVFHVRVFHVRVFHVRIFHVRVFHVRVFHVCVFHVRVFHVRVSVSACPCPRVHVRVFQITENFIANNA